MFLKNIFYIKKEEQHILYKFFGISLRIRYKIDYNLYKNFKKNVVAPHTVLIIEPNGCHYETVLGYCKYLTDLNYKVELLTSANIENLPIKNDLNIKIWECNKSTFDFIFKKVDFSKYYFLLFNSKRVYWNKKNTIDGCDIFDCYKKIPHGQKENIYVQHHIDFWNDNKKENQIILANPTSIKELDNCVVNPHYFGNISITPKNDKVIKFITVGELNESRRNSSLLINAVKELHRRQKYKFEVYIIGHGQLENIPKELHQYFKILGRTDFPTMFHAMEEADYFLPLLDPECKKHERYLKYGTSGSFQLIYGFLKPCIIHKAFADINGFTEENSFIYKDNFDLSKIMQEAIALSSEKYSDKQKALKEHVNNIEKISIKNLSNFIDKPSYHIVSLGDDCLVRRYLTRAGLKPTKKQGELSCPFDLAVTPTKSLIKILKNDFSDYFNHLCFSKEDNVWINKKYSILYNHDKDCTYKDKEKLINRFNLRINNFRRLMSTSPFIFFVCKSSSKFLDICKLYIQLKKIRKDLPFKLIVLDLDRKKMKLGFKNVAIYPLKHPFKNSNSWWQTINNEDSINFQKYVQKIIEENIKKDFKIINHNKEDINVENGEY